MEDEYYERDPRKRKVMSPVALIEERKDDRRRRSSSGSPDHRRKGLEEWQRKSDAFIKSMKATEGGYGSSQGYPSYHSSQNYRDEKSLYEREKRERPDFRRDHERRDAEPVKVDRDGSSRSVGGARGGDTERPASPATEKRNVLMTQEKRDKLLKTIEEYEAGTEGYEKKLLKLKEHREELKAKGHKHEDNTMKENAKLQKEIKHRIQCMKDFIEQKKTDYKGMEDELAAHKERERERERERMWREEQRMLEHQRKQAAVERNWDRESNGSAPETRRPNPDDAGRRIEPEIRRSDAISWQEKLEPSSKKAKDIKLASASESQSSSDSEVEQKKKRKKKKRKAASVSQSDSDSQTKKNDKKDDSDLSSLMGRKKKSGKDEDFQDFFSKLNDSYNKTKQELAEMTSRCSEMTSRCSILENQNRVLKKQVEDLTTQLKEKQEATELRTIRNVDPYPVKREPEFRDMPRDFGSGKQREEFGGYNRNYERGIKEEKEKKDGWKHDKFEAGHSPPIEKKSRDSEVRRDEEYTRFIKEFEPEPASKKYDDRKEKVKSDDYGEKYDKNHDKYHDKRHHHRDISPAEGDYGSGYVSLEDRKKKETAARSPSDDRQHHRYREDYDKRKNSYDNVDKKAFDAHYQQEEKRKVYQHESERRHYESDDRRHHESDERHRRYEEQSDERSRRYEEESSRHYESEDSRRRGGPAPPADWNNRRPDSKNDRRRYDTDERGRHESGDSRKHREDSTDDRRGGHDDRSGHESASGRHKQGVREESEDRSRSRHDRSQDNRYNNTKYERYYGGDVETSDHHQTRDKKKKKRSRSRQRSYSRSVSRSKSRSYDRSAKKKKKDKHRSRSSRSRSRSKDRKHKTRDTSSRSRSPSNRKSKSRKEKTDAINLDEWSKPPTKEGKEPGFNNLKEKIRAKEAERQAEESQNKWVPAAEAQQPPPQPPAPVQQVKQRESLERGLSPSRPSLNFSWGQGGKKQAEQAAQPTRKSATPMVGKMPWLKGNSSSTTTTSGRTSKFGPPVSQGTGIVPVVPPPQLVTAPVILGGSNNDASNVPLPPMPPIPKDPPPKNAPMYNTPPPNMMSQPRPPLPNLPPKIPRNPKPTSQVDVNAMLLAAKQHMQQSLNTKLSNIGLPPQQLGEALPDSIPLPESIPIPGNPPPSVPSFPMDMEVPLPSEPAPPPTFNESAPTTSNYGAPDNYSATKRKPAPDSDPAPPGEGPDLDELAMLGIDPSDSIM